MGSLAMDVRGEYVYRDQHDLWEPKLEQRMKLGLTQYQLGQIMLSNHRQGRFRIEVSQDTVAAGSRLHVKIRGITPFAALTIVSGRLDDGPPEAFGRIIVPFEESLDAMISIPKDAESGTYVFFGQQWEPYGQVAHEGGSLIYLSKISSVEVRSLTDEESSPWTPIFAKEMVRMKRFPGLAFRGPVQDRRAWVVGTAFDVWEIIEAYKAMGLERLLQEGDLPERKARLALRYYEAYSEEIDGVLAENQKSEEEWHRLYPEVLGPTEQNR